MRWVSYQSADGRERAGLLDSDLVHGTDMTMIEVLREFDGDLVAAAAAVRISPQQTMPQQTMKYDECDLLAPVPVPPSVRDFMAFESHVVTAMTAIGSSVSPVWYQQPVFYFSNPAGIVGPRDDVEISPGSQAFDYELEVAAVIGRAGRDLDPATAADHVAGYTILVDFSARDLQRAEMAVGLGPAKGKDGATALGPVLVTPDELAPFQRGNGYDLTMTASVNGTPYSRGTWADLFWSFGQMLAYASRGTWLRPGDVIGSGTVGTGCILELQGVHGPSAYPWLVADDVVEIEVEQLGTIRTRITPGRSPIPLR